MTSVSRNLTKICISITLISLILLLKISNCVAECIWIKKNHDLAGYKLTTMAADSKNLNIIYVGSKGFLFKTENGGENWKEIFKIPGISKAVNFIVVNPDNRDIIYIATESGAFKSDDGGANWQVMPLGAKEGNTLSLIIDSEDRETLFAGAEKGVFITTDGGKNWAASSEGLSATNIKSMAQSYIDRKIIFASAENGLFKSVDGAKTWKKVFSEDSVIEEYDNEYSQEDELPPPTSPTWVSIDSFDPNVIYLSTQRGLFKSSDCGENWTTISKAGLTDFRIKNLALPSYNRGFIFAATENGIFRFSEEENMWREFYVGLNSKEAVRVALSSDDDTLWLATKNGLYQSNGDIYEIKEITTADKAKSLLQNFSNEPSYQEIHEVAITYAEVHPDKIAKWRRAAKTKALLPRLSFSIDRDKSSGLHWDSGANPDTWVIGPDERSTGWDISCSWDLGELIWNGDQTLIDVRSKLMVELRDDVLDEVTHLYFARRRLQVEFMQNPPKNMDDFIEKEMRLQELTADIDAMTGGYLSRETARRKN